MPTPVLRTISKKAHKDLNTVEQKWAEAKDIAAKEGKPKNYALITHIAKKKLGLAKSAMGNFLGGMKPAKPHKYIDSRTTASGEKEYLYPGEKWPEEKSGKQEDIKETKTEKLEEQKSKKEPKLVIETKRDKKAEEPTQDKKPIVDDQKQKQIQPTLVLTPSGRSEELTQKKLDSLRVQDSGKIGQLSDEEWVSRYQDINEIFGDSKKSYKDRIKDVLKYDNEKGLLVTGADNRDWSSKDFMKSIPDAQLSTEFAEHENLKDLTYGDLIQVNAPELVKKNVKTPFVSAWVVGEIDGQYLVKWKETLFHTHGLDYKNERISYIREQLEELNERSDKNHVTKFLEELDRSLVGQVTDLKIEQTQKQNELNDLLSLDITGLPEDQKTELSIKITALREDLHKIKYGVKSTTNPGPERTFLVNKSDIRLKSTELKRGKEQDSKNQSRKIAVDQGKEMLKSMGYPDSPLNQITTVKGEPLSVIAKGLLSKNFSQSGFGEFYRDQPDFVYALLEERVWEDAANQAYRLKTGKSTVRQVESKSQKVMTSEQWDVDTHVRATVKAHAAAIAADFSRARGESWADTHAMNLYSEAEAIIHKDRAKFSDSYNQFRSHLSATGQEFYDGISSGMTEGLEKPTEITNIEEDFEMLRMLGDKNEITPAVINALSPVLKTFALEKIKDFDKHANFKAKTPQERINLVTSELLSMGADLQVYNQYSDGWYANMARPLRTAKLNWVAGVQDSYIRREAKLRQNMELDPQVKADRLEYYKRAIDNTVNRHEFYKNMPVEQFKHTAERALTSRAGQKQNPGVEAAATVFANMGKSIEEVNSLKSLSKMVASKTPAQYGGKELRAQYDAKVDKSLSQQGLTPTELAEIKDYYFASAIHLRKGMVGDPPKMSSQLKSLVANKLDEKVTDFMLSQYNVLFEDQRKKAPNTIRNYTVNTELLTGDYLKQLEKLTQAPSTRDLMAYNTNDDFTTEAPEPDVEAYESLRYGSFTGDLAEMDDLFDEDLARDY